MLVLSYALSMAANRSCISDKAWSDPDRIVFQTIIHMLLHRSQARLARFDDLHLRFGPGFR